MPNYRRYYIPDSIIFITSVTRDRYPYLKMQTDIDLFFRTFDNVKKLYPFDLLAYVILPDHFHLLMIAENISTNFSDIIRSMKRNFTLNFKRAHNISTKFSLWQDRFWDHVVRNEQDLENHIDYIHWNPVKHGYVRNPVDWKYSSYVSWVERGYYPLVDTDKLELPKSILTMDEE